MYAYVYCSFIVQSWQFCFVNFSCGWHLMAVKWLDLKSMAGIHLEIYRWECETWLLVSLRRCNYQFSYLNLNLTLNATASGLLKGYSQIEYRDSGILPWRTGFLTSSIYIDVANTGNITSNLTIVPNGCVGQDTPYITTGPLTQTIAANADNQFVFSTRKISWARPILWWLGLP